jgi:hypothetical protein
MHEYSIRSLSKLESAKGWLSLGIQVFPLHSGQKAARFKWAPWLVGLSNPKLEQHWSEYPDDDLAIIPGDQLVVLDADTDEALAALESLEAKHQLHPDLIVETRKGQHHYFRIPEGVTVRANSHSTEQYPERIDVRTGRHSVVVAPSTGKKVLGCSVISLQSMTPVTQELIDELMSHNGESTEVSSWGQGVQGFAEHGDEELINNYVRAMLSHLDPEEGGHDLWIRTLMAVHNATHGAAAGLEIVDEWSSAGETYPGRRTLESTWKSFRNDGGLTIGTIIWRLGRQGLDWVSVCDAASPQFETEEYEVITTTLRSAADINEHPLKQFSITSCLDEIKANAQGMKPALPPLALQGQMTVIYAPPNTGKTLLTLHMLIQSIGARHLNPRQAYYVNCDDSADGLLCKAELAQAYGFEMLADGYGGFQSKALMHVMVDMTAKNQARGTVLILDTLKKFVNVMDKTESSAFSEICRGFCLKGGTVIALAHTNKACGADGWPIPGGTSDVKDDWDSGYVARISKSSRCSKRVIEFKKVKGRGDLPEYVRYSYTANQGYLEMLTSVAREDDLGIEGLGLQHESQPSKDERIVAALKETIQRGVNPQMLIVDEVMSKTKAGKAKVKGILDRYEDALWRHTKKEHGAKHYELIGDAVRQVAVIDEDDFF